MSRRSTTRGRIIKMLQVVLDLSSAQPSTESGQLQAWMLAGRENSALAKQLFAQAISTHAIVPGQLHVHQDRGTPITAHGFIDLLNELGVDPSHSRPRVSNDNPSPRRSSRRSNTSPISPVRFRDIEHARAWCAEFFDWFNNHHQHSDLALFTPSPTYFTVVSSGLCSHVKRHWMLRTRRTLSASFAEGQGLRAPPRDHRDQYADAGCTDTCQYVAGGIEPRGLIASNCNLISGPNVSNTLTRSDLLATDVHERSSGQLRRCPRIP
jgi:hypothetical protein